MLSIRAGHTLNGKAVAEDRDPVGHGAVPGEPEQLHVGELREGLLGVKAGGAGNDQGFEVREFPQSPLYVLNLIDA